MTASHRALKMRLNKSQRFPDNPLSGFTAVRDRPSGNVVAASQAAHSIEIRGKISC